ncbi:MAG: hypothetical protein IJT70_04445 [Clostridia bacterium]|nr:hypothetical protein [Clostridia bacterium]
MKSIKRALALLLIIAISVPLSVFSFAIKEYDIVDRSTSFRPYNRMFGLLNSVASPDSEKQVFNYTVPENGAAVIVFYRSNGQCGNSNRLFEDLRGTEWASDPKVKLIAVESDRASYDTVRSYLDRYDPDGLVDAAYFNESSPACLAWYIEYIKREGDMDGLTSVGGSVSFPYIMIVGNENGNKVIKRVMSGDNSIVSLTAAVASVADIEDEVERIVDVKIPGIAKYDYIESELEKVNAARAENGVPALTLSPQLTELAMLRAAECSLYYSHNRPDGSECFSVSDEFPIYQSGFLRAENIAAGYETTDQVVIRWLESSGHRRNILNKDNNQIGIGCFVNNGYYFWVQLFGAGEDDSVLSETEAVDRVYDACSLESLIYDPVAPDASFALCSPFDYNVTVTNVGNNCFLPVNLVPYDAIVSSGDVAIASFANGTLCGEHPGTGTLSVRLYEEQETPATASITVGDHYWNNGTTVRGASCTEEGLIRYTCSACGAVRNDAISKTEHVYSSEYTVDVEPTYTSAGTKSRHCTVCGARTDEIEIPRLISHLKGDVNGDGVVNMKDYLLFRKATVNIADIAPEYFANADCNSDGLLTMKDALIIRKICLGIINPYTL